MNETAQTVIQYAPEAAWINILGSIASAFVALLPFMIIIFWPRIQETLIRTSVRHLIRQLVRQTGMGVIVLGDLIDIKQSNKLEEKLSIFEQKGVKEVMLILDTPGGYEFAMKRISDSILSFKGNVHAYIPRYAMSAGTMIALSCKSLHMTNKASLGMLDPQIGILFWVHSSKAWQEIIRKKGTKANDESIAMALYAKQYMKLMRNYLDSSPLLKGKDRFKNFLVYGDQPHAFQMNRQYLAANGVKVNVLDNLLISKIVNKNPKGIIAYLPKGKAI